MSEHDHIPTGLFSGQKKQLIADNAQLLKDVGTYKAFVVTMVNGIVAKKLKNSNDGMEYDTGKIDESNVTTDKLPEYSRQIAQAVNKTQTDHAQARDRDSRAFGDYMRFAWWKVFELETQLQVPHQFAPPVNSAPPPVGSSKQFNASQENPFII
tara:strand:+ start:10508 stop:10969 length:462 start_codon:yes stop_codon:yes gene_type:complete